MMWDGNGNWSSGGGWVMFALTVVVVIAVIVAIAFLVRYIGRTSGGTPSMAAASPAFTTGPESPKDVLKRRYAAGEIDRGECLRMLGDL